LPVRDYECSCGYTETRLTSGETYPKWVKCSKCGSRARHKWSSGATYRMAFREGWNASLGKNLYSQRECNNYMAAKHYSWVKD